MTFINPETGERVDFYRPHEDAIHTAARALVDAWYDRHGSIWDWTKCIQDRMADLEASLCGGGKHVK